MTKSKLSMGQVILNICMVALMCVLIFPVLWMISCSFKSNTELFVQEIYPLPKMPTVEHYVEVFENYGIGYWFINSLGTTVGTAILSITVTFMAAFALGYFRTKLNSLVFYFLLLTMVIANQ